MTAIYSARGAGHTHHTPVALLECDTCALAAEHETALGVYCVVVLDGTTERRLNSTELAELSILLGVGDGGRAA